MGTFIKNIFISLLAVLLIGCETNSNFKADKNISTVDKTIHTKAIKHFTGKPAADIKMNSAVEKDIQVNTIVNVDINFINEYDVDDLQLRFKLDKGLQTDESLHTNFGILAAGTTSTVTLSVWSADEGLYYIHVLATLVTDKQQSRSFAVPVNIGNVDVKKNLKTTGEVIIDSAGRRIIKTPATMK